MIARQLQQIPHLFTNVSKILTLMWQAQPLALTGIILLNILQGLTPLANAWVTKLLFDLLAQRLSGTPVDFWSQLFWLLVVQAILMVTSHAINPTVTFLKAELDRRLTISIQTRIYQKITSFTGIAYFENPNLHDTIRLANEGARNGTQQTLWLLTSLVQSAVTLFSFIGLLLAFSPLLAGLVILAAAPQLYAQLKLGQQRVGLIHNISPDERRKFYYSTLLSGTQAAKEIRLYDTGTYFLDKLLHLYQQVHQAERNLQKRELWWQAFLGVLSSLVASVAFIVVVIEAFARRISLGDVTLYINAVRSVQQALSGSLFALSGLYESSLFYTYYTELLAMPESLPLATSPQPIQPLSSGIELRHLSFRYSPDHPWILRDANLFIPQGQCLALVGLNGTGKTTLVKLLLRFYDPSEGQILWDGIDIREFDPKALRQRMGAIFQDYLRYDLTAQENIGLGQVDYVNDLDRVQRAAKKSGAHEMIQSLSQGYQTELTLMFANGRSPIDLSGGQWQKIAMARLFMRQEANLLILDEPTAALDAQAEHDLFDQFVELANARTTLLISHRFSTVKMADCIAVLDNGRIIEHGSHEELLALGGKYAELYTMQAEKYRA